VKNFRDLMQMKKHDFRERLPKIYSQDLLNNLFRYPYTKIEFIERELSISRPTASKYLEQMTAAGLVRKQKLGRTNFYINEPLVALLSGVALDLP
jgi:Mn-dependent DtxR family transcriptional regulator